ncbi:MAG: hypothetical protein PVG07_10565 [Acidobacteriota bacterium]|jgi:hypothetical protein
MSRLEQWTVHLSILLVGGTGLVYAWMKYLMEPSDPFAVVNHPFQPTIQHLHVLTAPLLVFGVGIIWREHIWKHWSRGVRTGRRSGASMLLTAVPMVLSGYLIQTTVTEGWRTAWIVLHLVASGLWVVGYLSHSVVLERLRARSRERRREREEARPRLGEASQAPPRAS